MFDSRFVAILNRFPKTMLSMLLRRRGNTFVSHGDEILFYNEKTDELETAKYCSEKDDWEVEHYKVKSGYRFSKEYKNNNLGFSCQVDELQGEEYLKISNNNLSNTVNHLILSKVDTITAVVKVVTRKPVKITFGRWSIGNVHVKTDYGKPLKVNRDYKIIGDTYIFKKHHKVVFSFRHTRAIDIKFKLDTDVLELGIETTPNSPRISVDIETPNVYNIIRKLKLVGNVYTKFPDTMMNSLEYAHVDITCEDVVFKNAFRNSKNLLLAEVFLHNVDDVSFMFADCNELLLIEFDTVKDVKYAEGFLKGCNNLEQLEDKLIGRIIHKDVVNISNAIPPHIDLSEETLSIIDSIADTLSFGFKR